MRHWTFEETLGISIAYPLLTNYFCETFEIAEIMTKKIGIEISFK